MATNQKGELIKDMLLPPISFDSLEEARSLHLL